MHESTPTLVPPASQQLAQPATEPVEAFFKKKAGALPFIKKEGDITS
jgi:hypothetical protein